MAMARHRVAFRRSLRAAQRTGSPAWGTVPVMLATWWWIRGVPDDRLRNHRFDLTRYLEQIGKISPTES